MAGRGQGVRPAALPRARLGSSAGAHRHGPPRIRPGRPGRRAASCSDPARRLHARSEGWWTASGRRSWRVDIDRSFAERSSGASGGPSSEAYYEEFTLGRAQSAAREPAGLDPIRGRGACSGFPAAGLRHVRDLRGGRASRRDRRLPGRATRDVGARSAPCERLSPASPAPGTRTAPSWATCARSTSGSSLSRCGDEAPGSRSGPAPARRARPDRRRRGHVRQPDLPGHRRARRRRARHPATDLRAGRRAALRRPLPAPHRAPILRCRSHASRSRAGSSVRPPFPRTTLHWPSDRGPSLRRMRRSSTPAEMRGTR